MGNINIAAADLGVKIVSADATKGEAGLQQAVEQALQEVQYRTIISIQPFGTNRVLITFKK